MAGKAKTFFGAMGAGMLTGAALGAVAMGMTSQKARSRVTKQAKRVVNSVNDMMTDLGNIMKN